MSRVSFLANSEEDGRPVAATFEANAPAGSFEDAAAPGLDSATNPSPNRGRGNLPLPIISLSEQFLKLLKVGPNSAYALAPVFAARIDVFSVSSLSHDKDSLWKPAMILVTKDGLLYLFDSGGNRAVMNAARLAPREEIEMRRARRLSGMASSRHSSTMGGMRRGSSFKQDEEEGAIDDDMQGSLLPRQKARVDVVVEAGVRRENMTQCAYIRCRDAVALQSLLSDNVAVTSPPASPPQSILKERSASVPPSRAAAAQVDAEVPDTPAEGEGGGSRSRRMRGSASVTFSEAEQVGGAGYGDPDSKPFSYIFRFHSRNADVALQFVTIVKHFADEVKGELSLKRVEERLENIVPENAVADPFLSIKSGKNSRSSSVTKLGGFLKRTNSTVSPGGDAPLSIADVARREKQRIQKAQGNILIPPKVLSSSSPPPPRQPCWLPPQGQRKGKVSDAATVTSSLPRQQQDGDAAKAGEGGQGPVASFLLVLFPNAPRFTFAEREDVLKTYGQQGFDAQCALFMEDPAVQLFIQQAAQRLLADQGMTQGSSPHLYDSYVARAREICREEVRTHFSVPYLELNKFTRKEIAGLSLDSLILEDQKKRIEALFNSEAAAVRSAADAELKKIEQLDSSIYFRESDPYSPEHPTGVVPTVCDAESQWRRELLSSRRALREAKAKNLKLRKVLYMEYNDEPDNGDSQTSQGGVPGAQRRIAAEAERLLAQVAQEETIIQSMQQQLQALRLSRQREIEATYGEWVEQQQEEINTLKDHFNQLAQCFGLHPQLSEPSLFTGLSEASLGANVRKGNPAAFHVDEVLPTEQRDHFMVGQLGGARRSGTEGTRGALAGRGAEHPSVLSSHVRQMMLSDL